MSEPCYNDMIFLFTMFIPLEVVIIIRLLYYSQHLCHAMLLNVRSMNKYLSHSMNTSHKAIEYVMKYFFS